MTKEVERQNETLLDKRVVFRNIQKKLITEQEYKKYLSSLKDESHSCDRIEIEDEKN